MHTLHHLPAVSFSIPHTILTPSYEYKWLERGFYTFNVKWNNLYFNLFVVLVLPVVLRCPTHINLLPLYGHAGSTLEQCPWIPTARPITVSDTLIN